MKIITRNLLAGVALGALLSACSDRASDVAPPPVASPPPAALTLPQQIGAAFNALFIASNEVEATEPAPGSVPPLALDSEPIAG